MRKSAVVSMIAMFTMNSWAATVGDAGRCVADRAAFEKADAQRQRLSPAEQRRFPSFLSSAHNAENTWSACAGLPALEAPVAERYALVRGEK